MVSFGLQSTPRVDLFHDVLIPSARWEVENAPKLNFKQ